MQQRIATGKVGPHSIGWTPRRQCKYAKPGERPSARACPHPHGMKAMVIRRHSGAWAWDSLRAEQADQRHLDFCRLGDVFAPRLGIFPNLFLDRDQFLLLALFISPPLGPLLTAFELAVAFRPPHLAAARPGQSIIGSGVELMHDRLRHGRCGFWRRRLSLLRW